MKQALYRKYRPKTFDEVLGQDNIVNILKNQIKNDKISHAYIFSGTRGTGKTSSAKIFAKAVNCLNPINGNPCNECENCKAINEENTMDIVEMDAASNRRIDDIRQLRDQVIYPPSNLKFKVYIIDEAHMITNEGFNALLKIMEEPPRHLIFILATTEIEKIPNTILSRTQRFEFKSISHDDIIRQIDLVLNKENITMEDSAKDVIANAGSGAMRDSLSILDQVISISKDNITSDDVYDLLGIFSDDIKYNFTKAVFDKDVEELFRIIDVQVNKGKTPNNFIKEIISFFKTLIYVKTGVEESELSNLVSNISLEQIVNSIDILLQYEETMKKSDSADLLFKICATRLIDYMPRKVLESKIKNLEERVVDLEKRRPLSTEKNSSSKSRDEKHDSKPIEINDEGSFLEEDEAEIKNTQKEIAREVEKFEEEHDIEFRDEAVGEDSNEESSNNDENYTKQNHSDILIDILKEKYAPTNLFLEGLESARVSGDKIILYIDSEHYSMSVGMSFFFSKAKLDLKEKTGKLYDIECKVHKESREEDSLQEEKMGRLQDLFGDNINIKDRKN